MKNNAEGAVAAFFRTLVSLPARALIGLIRVYQLVLSPWIGNQCRFHPTCSHYAVEAVERYGALKGSWLALTRLLKCQPFHNGGFDPVPDRPSFRTD